MVIYTSQTLSINTNPLFLVRGLCISLTSFSGDITVAGSMSVIPDLSGPMFKLTCISTGGPATTVTWTRDSVAVSVGKMTVLDDRETAQYTHTLTVSGRLGGLYQCTVSNNKPSSDSAQLIVQGA